MSKSVLEIGLSIVAVGVAIFAPELLPLIGPGLVSASGALTALGVAVVAATEIGIALVSSTLLGPAVPKSLANNNVNRLYATLVTTEPRKIMFGVTASAARVRYL